MEHIDFSRSISPAIPPPLEADFVLGEWLVQPGLNRLIRNGTRMHVRPQLMDVLVCLARASGRTVHRDELLQQVWRGQSLVAESAVARCIAELRQALGDQATSPTLIETIHKRGYRLIARVAPAEDVPPVARTTAAAMSAEPVVTRRQTSDSPPPPGAAVVRGLPYWLRRWGRLALHACLPY